MTFTRADNIVIKVLRQEKGYGAKKFIREFPSKNILEQRVYRTRIRDINHLKARLTVEWHNFDHKIIDWAIKQWRPRLRACIQEQGGHFEHQL